MKTRRIKGGNFTLASIGSAAASAILPFAFFMGARALRKRKFNKTKRR
jgi:hypothetical protein